MDLTTTVLMVLLFVLGNVAEGGFLNYNYYDKSCPQLENIVRAGLVPLFVTDPTSPAALLRLMFHDCQVQGCDASILVDPIAGNMSSEMASVRNFGIRKRELISVVKSMVEAACPQRVTCADILILAAREAVAMSGGPHIEVPLGRKDSFTAPSYRQADASIPPAITGVDDMLHIFTSKGMTIQESVALIGAHTLGVTHCASILNRLYKNAESEKAHQEMEPGFEAFLMLNCPEWSLTSNISFVLNDPTAFIFDNLYYKSAMGGRGVLRIDAEMASDPRTAQIVKHFASDRDDFFRSFSSAFVKLSTSGVLIGYRGVIRKRCNVLD